MTANEKLVYNIRSIAKKKGIPISQIERNYKWSSGLISRWSKTSPSIDKVIDVIRYLNVDYEDILGKIESSSVEKTDDYHSDDKNTELIDKLIVNTEEKKSAWLLCTDDFQNDEIKGVVKNAKVYASPFESGFFFVIVRDKNVDFATITGIQDSVKYYDDMEETQLISLLRAISEEEFIDLINRKNNDFVEKFMNHKF